MTEITKQTLSDLVENIKKKKVSSAEVTKAFIERSKKSKSPKASELIFKVRLTF